MKPSLRNSLAGLVLAAILIVAYVQIYRRDNVVPPRAAADASPLVTGGVADTTSSYASNTASANNATGAPAIGPIKTVIPNALTVDTTSTNTPSERTWDPQFFSRLAGLREGSLLHFELTDGEWAEGTINHLERRNGEIVYVGGKLLSPEGGRFFFLKTLGPGKAGEAAGVVELTSKEFGYRVEPTASGSAKLVRHKLGDLVCLNLPLPPAEGTNVVENIPPLNPSQFPTNLPIAPYQQGIIPLQSLPGASAVIYLDFQGGYTPTWGGITYEKPNFGNAEIFYIWKLVSERFMAFTINVTTDLGVFTNAPQTSRQRTIITPTKTAAPGTGGVSYIGSFNWGGVPDTPNWAFNVGSTKTCGETIAHECGHALDLGHAGREIGGTNHEEYYYGQGSGDTGWAPIMGAAYNKAVAQWCIDEYQWANNHFNTMNHILGNNNVDYRADDTGSTYGSSRYLELYAGNTASAQGVVERAADTDAFRFTLTNFGTINLTANPVGYVPNTGLNNWASLAIAATLCDATDTVIASNNPQNLLSATINTNLPAGNYTFRVTGAGRNDPFLNGFSTYASFGYYSVTGTVTSARLPNRFVIAENTPNGTLVGNVLPTVNNGDARIYNITSGNTGSAFTFTSSGNLLVANTTQLNYETLGLNTQLPVQFELLVNIVDTVNSLLTETNRRVIIAITNVNEPPVVPAVSLKVLAHTQPGTVIGNATASDPDFFSLVSYSIVGGNTNNAFSINNSSGAIFVTGDLDNNLQSVYSLAVAASDLTPPSPLVSTGMVTVTILPNNSPFHPGSIGYAVYTNIPGQLISDLTSAPSYPDDPAFEKQQFLFDGENGLGENYGAVMRGYLIPPATGLYTFWIASDDNGELWLSTSTNPASITRRAYLSGSGIYSGYRVWTDYPSQQSSTVSLVAGQAYYIEGRLKEEGGGDYISVAWQCASAGIPQEVIPGKYLAPYQKSYQPHLTDVTMGLHRDAITGSRVGALPIFGGGTNTPRTFTILGGNPDGIFSVDATNGMVRVADETALRTTAQSSYSLSIQVSNNLPPAFPASAIFTINLVESNTIVATSIYQEVFLDIGTNTTVPSLLAASKYPRRPDLLRPLTAFDSGGDLDQGSNYGSRIRGLLSPSTSGTYNFYISSDDNSQLLFSLTTNSAGAGAYASVGTYTGHQEWNKFSSQRSANLSLTAGQRYYIEARQKEGSGDDHVAVAWTGPGIGSTNVIDGSALSPVDINYAPELTNRSLVVSLSVPNGTLIGTLTALDSPLEMITYRITSGNTNNTFSLDPDSGRLFVASNTLITNQAVSKFTLQVQAQDSGYSDLYPRRSTNTTVTVNVHYPPEILPVWLTGGSLVIQYQTLIGVTYVVQTATNLATPVTWTSIATNAGNGGIRTLTPNVSAQPQAFFRILSYQP